MSSGDVVRADPALDFDLNGSTPVHPRVLEAIMPFLSDVYGNPSAAHPAGQRARRAIEAARETVGIALGADANEIVFTSGGTESNNWVFAGSFSAARPGHLVTSSIEHRSVLACAQALEQAGHEVTWLPVDASGAVRLRDVEAAVRPDTTLVSVMMANNETGVVQPVREIGRLCRAQGVRFHTDAVCTIGKLPVDVRDLCCDFLSLSSHKLYAPKGSGVLYVRRGVELPALIHGCGQQLGRRSGTENAFGAVGFACALELARSGALRPSVPVEKLRDALWRGIGERLPRSERNGSGAFLPNTLNVCFPGTLASDVQRELGWIGLSVSSGSSATGAGGSHVLQAMGLSLERARSSVRFSLGTHSTVDGVRALLDALEEVIPACIPTSLARSAT